MKSFSKLSDRAMERAAAVYDARIGLNYRHAVWGVRGDWLRMLLAFVACGLAAAPAQAWERDDVLHAIHQVENPTNSTRIGRWGELGPYQFRPGVWHTYTTKPFALAADQAESRAVANLHYDWIARGLQRNNFEVTPYYIALAWNSGLNATLNGKTSRRSEHYARRVANLVEHASPAAAELAAR